MTSARPLRIGVTSSMIYGNREGGVQRYLDCVLAEMAGIGGAEIVVFAPPCHDTFTCFARPGIRKARVPAFWNHPLRNIFWHLFVFPFRLRREGVTLLWIPELRRQVPLFGGRTVTTIHDMARYQVPGKYDAARMFYHMRVLPYLMRRNSRYIAVSENTRQDIHAFLGIPLSRIAVVHNGIDSRLFAPRGDDALPAGVSGRYFLYVARLEHPAKNHLRLIRAFARFGARHPDFTLVLVGSVQSQGEVVVDAVRASGARVLHLGFVSDAELRALYRGAEALVFPSLYEGFGLPLLEAMACGTAVAAAERGCVPEVCGAAALYFDPEAEGSIDGAMERLSSDAGLRAQLREAGAARVREFSWRETARKHLEMFRETQDAP